MAGQTPKSRAALDQMYKFIAQHNGGFDPRQVFNIAPNYAQRIEEKVMQSNAFLKQINSTPVDSLTGQVLGFDVPDTITSRTTERQTDGSFRRPSDPTKLVDRSFACKEIEQDPMIPWKKIDQWAGVINDFYPRFRRSVDFAKARDMLLIMWYGQGAVANTDKNENPLLQDVQRGFVQYLISNAPSQVSGIILDAAEPSGYRVEEIRIGPGAGANGFENLDQAVNYLKSMKIDRLFRKMESQRVLVGEQLLIRDRAQMLGVAGNVATERVATQILARTASIGEVERANSDELPDHLIFVSPMDNLSHYWLPSSMRAKYDEVSHEKKGVVSYYYKECDNVVEAVEAAACFHPDAIRVPGPVVDAVQTWIPATETWKKVIS